MSCVFASAETAGRAGPSRSAPDSGGANTVAGSGTDTSSAPSFTSVPAHGVAPTGATGAAGTPAGAAGSGSREPEPDPRPELDPAPGPEPEPAPGPGPEAEPPPAAAAGLGAMPALSAASWSHSGGLRMNDVCSASIRGDGTDGSGDAADTPYSSS